MQLSDELWREPSFLQTVALIEDKLQTNQCVSEFPPLAVAVLI